MGSVQQQIDCPNCKNEAFEDFNYKTGEEYMSCSNCGYHKSFYYERDDSGKFVLIDETKEADFGNFKIKEVIIDKPVGSYSIEKSNRFRQVGSFETQQEYEGFKITIKEMLEKDKSEIAEVKVSRFIDGEIKVEEIYSNQNV